MSEFQEAHTVSTLKGSPPGYVGYGEGGVLTEAVRRRPYSVVLLDEVEKAHPDVLELFFQVFDKGKMEDGEGREIDFKNTIIILTSNAGTDTLMKLTADPETMPRADGLGQGAQAGAGQDLQARLSRPAGDHSVLPDPRRSAEADHPAQARQDPAAAAGDPQITLTYDDALVDEVAQALHGSGERRAQRRQHSDQHAAAGDFQAVPGAAWRRECGRNGSTSVSAKTVRSSTPRAGPGPGIERRSTSCLPLRFIVHFGSRRRSATTLCCSRASKGTSASPTPFRYVLKRPVAWTPISI